MQVGKCPSLAHFVLWTYILHFKWQVFFKPLADFTKKYCRKTTTPWNISVQALCSVHLARLQSLQNKPSSDLPEGLSVLCKAVPHVSGCWESSLPKNPLLSKYESKTEQDSLKHLSEAMLQPWAREGFSFSVRGEKQGKPARIPRMTPDPRSRGKKGAFSYWPARQEGLFLVGACSRVPYLEGPLRYLSFPLPPSINGSSKGGHSRESFVREIKAQRSPFTRKIVTTHRHPFCSTV